MYEYDNDLNQDMKDHENHEEEIKSAGEVSPPLRRKRNVVKVLGSVALAAVIGGSCFGLGMRVGVGAGFYEKAQAAENMSAGAESMDNDSYIFASSVLMDNSNSVADVVKAVKDSVVSINMTAQQVVFNRVSSVEGAGSGIIFREDADRVYIATNYHVIYSATKVTISLDDVNHVPANYVGGDEKNDLAVISVKKSDLKSVGGEYKIASFANSDKVQVGDAAIAIGNALGEGKSASLGIVSAIGTKMGVSAGMDIPLIRTDAAINPGNSGGALVDSAGKVIGVNSAKVASAEVEGMGYAIASNAALEIINEIMKTGSVERPYLGIKGVDITAQIKEYYGFSTTGVYVNQIFSGTTSESIGLKAGDIIVSFNGVKVTDMEGLGEEISKTKVGEKLTLEVVRNNKKITLTGIMEKYVGENNF